MSEYVKVERLRCLPRLPLEGSLDLTYRCNNTCRHCWLWLPADAAEQRDELSCDEIRGIAEEARAMGCRSWNLSGGEPMLRPDFPEIFDYLTHRFGSFSLNTNGTLITPAIAELMKRKGRKMVALYGATAEVYDHVTRHPGGFERALEGMRLLKQAGAAFMVQLIPMRANWHQWDEMVKLAQTLSPHWRVGAPWLFLSACGSPARNAEIARQRLDSADIIALDPPSVDGVETQDGPCGSARNGDDRVFAACIKVRQAFHIDPYGRMTFCSFVKDPALRYDLRHGAFSQAWNDFIPSLAAKVHGGQEYLDNCHGCEHRDECRWCSVYGYLEHRRHSAPVSHLCDLARARKAYRENWRTRHRRFFRLAGITIQVDSDLPLSECTLRRGLRPFEVDAPGEDTVTIRHRFEIPEWDAELGSVVCAKPPCQLYRRRNGWVYVDISGQTELPARIAVSNSDHSRTVIYHRDSSEIASGYVSGLTLLPSDAILLAPLLAAREASMFHGSGVVVNGQGLLFLGQSGAGKSTITRQLANRAVVLCDERVIVRRREDGFRLYGTWNNGEVGDVSSENAPLRGFFLLRKASSNRLTPLPERQALAEALLPCLVQPLSTAEWWPVAGKLVAALARGIPAYTVDFDLSGGIVPVLTDFAASAAQAHL